MRPRVLVTRPEAAAQATASALGAMGCEPLVLPLTETRALPPAGPLDPEEFDALAVTSASALRHADPLLLAPLRHRSLFAVGARTAAAAARAGFATIREGGGDAAALAAALLSDEKARRVLYLCGRVRRPDFERLLAAGGVNVAAVETYDTVAFSPPHRMVQAVLGGAAADAVLVYSVLAAQAFRELLARPEASSLLAPAAPFALSPRIAAAFEDPAAAFVPVEPNEDALLALLRQWKEARGRASFQAVPV